MQYIQYTQYMNHCIKIEYRPFEETNTFVLTSYYVFNEEQYKSFNQWNNENRQTWVCDEYLTITTEHHLTVTEIEYDENRNVYNGYNGCKLLEHIPEFIHCGFFNAGYKHATSNMFEQFTDTDTDTEDE